MTKSSSPASSAPYRQSIAGCLSGAIGAHGLSESELGRWLEKCAPALHDLKADHASGRLPLLKIAEETADIDEADAALTRLLEGGNAVVFFGTGGSGLGGQTLAQLAGWNLPGVSCCSDLRHPRPQTRFYDNLDPLTLAAGLNRLDLAKTRFVVTSKSGGTTETLAQLLTTLAAVKAAGLESQIPKMFLGITEPEVAGKTNGLRALLASLGVPMIPHHTGIGGRFSCLTNVGLMPAMARGLDVRKIRAGAQEVIDSLVSSSFPAAFAPAIGAATAVGLSKERGIRTLVMMPYNDRLGRFSEWYVQLWAESLGKGGEGTTPVPALGPLDQHSQLQLFMDGPREIAVTLVRVASAGEGPVLDAEMAKTAGQGFLGGRTIGDVVDAQAHAIADALTQAGRPVRTFDLAALDERTMGALLMHFMIETILAGRLLELDPFDQPAVELAKTLTRERLAR
ncbi:MAG: glucose-6-phosphate isomerase [Hyphomicrobium sp.]|jgi:glucose-6-phosphate isomerase|uniref:glucose-6-phosphate isomerase n=1 Tax=Hyphomicrobium sp. TaxID=82 RepID=UPI0025C6702C|nr:glucose-6-phosphate isomerase [Hyphomicrobium sp.]MBX9862308.1 glucose-6-phosphate isomerase [Hyphomicrobium sp.]